MNFQKKDTYTMDDLLKIMDLLRSPEGCPWDREQTHQSIRNNFLEETYEAVEAIDTQDPVLLQEELGDVLLQVVFHAQLEKEKNGFSFSDVVDGIVRKLVVRHPHVFGETVVKNSEEVLENWEDIKRQTKGRKTDEQVLRSVSPALPALMRTQRVCRKASKAAGEQENFSKAMERVRDSAKQLSAAAEKSGNETEQKEKVGKLLLSVVEASGLLNIEAEEALSVQCDRFISNFLEQKKQQPVGGKSKDHPVGI